MQFRSEFHFPSAPFSISYGDKIVSIGSCFSENMGNKLAWCGFEVLNNPYGTIFHPSAIANLLRFVVTDEPVQWRTISRGDVFFSLDVHSACFAYSESELIEILELKRKQLRNYLAEAKLCIITLGTAWGYYQNQNVVANCHKLSVHQFDKKLTDLNEMQSEWLSLIQSIHKWNPDLEFVFTISPVRHLKDGFVENQRSKSRLIELVHSLSGINYFPSYEIMLDDLRNYRFYAEDLIHPSSQAVDYIFDKFSAWILDEKSCKLMAGIGKLRNRQRHKLLFSESTEAKRFEQETQELIRQFCQTNPQVKW